VVLLGRPGSAATWLPEATRATGFRNGFVGPTVLGYVECRALPLDARGRRRKEAAPLIPKGIAMKISSKRAAALTGTASLVATVALWPSTAAAGHDGERTSDGGVIEGPIVSDREEEAFLDHDGNGLPSLGDALVFTDSASGVLGTGSGYGSCLLHEVDLSAGSATVHCASTVEAADGSVTFQGTSRVGLEPPVLLEPATWAITGGTGEYLEARGELRITRFEGSGPDFRVLGTLRLHR
jgi:hypothetical protein